MEANDLDWDHSTVHSPPHRRGHHDHNLDAHCSPAQNAGDRGGSGSASYTAQIVRRVAAHTAQQQLTNILSADSQDSEIPCPSVRSPLTHRVARTRSGDFDRDRNGNNSISPRDTIIIHNGPKQQRPNRFLRFHKGKRNVANLLNLLLRFILIGGGIGYVILILRAFSRMEQDEYDGTTDFSGTSATNTNHHSPPHNVISFLPESLKASVSTYHHPLVVRDRQDKIRLEKKQQAEREAKTRSRKRRTRTRPSSFSSKPSKRSDPPKVKPYVFSLMDDRPSTAALEQLDSVPASLSDLCGAHAKRSSTDRPNSFLERDALNSKSRVLITGILNPVGFGLALKLNQQCGVQHMMGIDPMFPNTVTHRLELQQRIAILTASIPKLVQPIVLPMVGLDAKGRQEKRYRSGKYLGDLRLQATGEANLLAFQPTHIIHLASYSMEEYSDANAEEKGRLNKDSPYVSTKPEIKYRQDLLYVRSSMASMEHILSSIASVEDVVDQPHLTYASSKGVVSHDSEIKSGSHTYDKLFKRVKLAEEILAETYYSLRNVYSVGLRLPKAVYGPWGRPGSPEYELAEAAIRVWSLQSSLEKGYTTNLIHTAEYVLASAGLTEDSKVARDFVYVDDVLDSIIAAMQYRSEGSSPEVFGISSEQLATLDSAATIIESSMPQNAGHENRGVAVSEATDASLERTKHLLQWNATTTLTHGILKLVAWHLDKASPYGPPRLQRGQNEEEREEKRLIDLETGYSFLTRSGIKTCEADDNVCHGGNQLHMCASECAEKPNCLPSAFDDVVDVVREVSLDCDIVLYTDSLGYDVKDLQLRAEYKEDGDVAVCNFAFVPAYSALVRRILGKVPSAQFVNFGISPIEDESSEDLLQRKHDIMNGHLLYKGWIVVWVRDALEPLPVAYRNLLKINPGKLFSPTVHHAMYVTEDFRVTPSNEDIEFLVDITSRAARNPRSAYRMDEQGKNIKYKLPEEPKRRAILLMSPLKYRLNAEELDKPEGDKITVREAVRYMTYEIGRDPAESETPEVRLQREFYERVAHFSNKLDMRSPHEPWYRYELKHWTRSRWIVHDMKHEDGRQIRCQWFNEHSLWHSEFDQLSLAHVMAMLDLNRRIMNQDPDDKVKTAVEESPVIRELTDNHEWHTLERTLGTGLPGIPIVDEEGKDKTEVPTIHFVRIMSERFMMLARKKWAIRKKRSHR